MSGVRFDDETLNTLSPSRRNEVLRGRRRREAQRALREAGDEKAIATKKVQLERGRLKERKRRARLKRRVEAGDSEAIMITECMKNQKRGGKAKKTAETEVSRPASPNDNKDDEENLALARKNLESHTDIADDNGAGLDNAVKEEVDEQGSVSPDVIDLCESEDGKLTTMVPEKQPAGVREAEIQLELEKIALQQKQVDLKMELLRLRQR